MWYRLTARWLALGLLGSIPVLIALQDSASATTLTLTIIRPAATSGPTGAFSEVRSNAACGVVGGSQQLVSGGGVSVTLSSNSIKVNGSAPWNGTSEITGTVTGTVANNSPAWLGVGGSGGQGDSSAADTAFAMCFSKGATTDITGTDIVMNSTPGPLAADDVSTTVATCPVGDRLLSGGARVYSVGSGNDKPVASYPAFSTSTVAATAAPNGSINPNQWVAVGMTGGTTHTAADITTYAYAVCATGGAGHVTTTVRTAEVAGPTASSGAAGVTTTCQAGDGSLVGGGAAIDGGGVTTTTFVKPGSQGDHLTGSFPSDTAGNPVVSGTTTAAVWSAKTHAGGSTSPGTVSDVWAMCVKTT